MWENQNTTPAANNALLKDAQQNFINEHEYSIYSYPCF